MIQYSKPREISVSTCTVQPVIIMHALNHVQSPQLSVVQILITKLANSTTNAKYDHEHEMNRESSSLSFFLFNEVVGYAAIISSITHNG